ncbi:MAG: hypothetical protein KDD37_04805 [Bdellovibrionales bacterium]|nr:hypothetical protein [Bdellovibrionales bacterium]
MKALKILNNQQGMMAMMGAMIFTIAITTTLSTFYVYTLNQAKYHARIKEAYQLINIMESFATATRKAYDMGMSANASAAPCPDGSAPQQVTGATGKYFCSNNSPVCFKREDTGDEYCSTVSFASNVTIEKKTSYAEAKTKSFLKTWRKGLNDFYLSPGLKNRVLDSSTVLSSVIKRPSLLDWLAPSEAFAQYQQEAPVSYTYPNPTSTPAQIDGRTTTTTSALPTATPVGGGVTYPGETSTVSYIDCNHGMFGAVCTVVTNGDTGQQAKGTSEQNTGDSAVAGQTSPKSGVYGGGGSTGETPTVTCSSLPPSNSYCSYCKTGQFCPSVGGKPGQRGGLQLKRDGQYIGQPLPVRQKFSIIM